MHAIAWRFTLASFALVSISLVGTADEGGGALTDSVSGLKIDEKEIWKLARANCGSCHSGRLLAQQSLDRDGWLEAIRRMQSKENLWDLGDSEELILDYLSENYGKNESRSNKRVRRAPLNQQPIEHDNEKVEINETIDETQPEADAESTAPINSN